MPNQVNYPDPIPVPYIQYRPERLSSDDRELVQDDIRQILFGSSPKDYAELWVYDSNGGIAGHVNLNVTFPSMSLSTDITETGAYELLNIDMGAAVRMMVVESGRYGFTANFFRDEVGSEYIDDSNPRLGSGQKLYISNISDDRTELLLSPKVITEELLLEIKEWVEPSVPILYAQGLVDQTFGYSFPADGESEVPSDQVLSSQNVMDALDIEMFIDPSVSARVQASGTRPKFDEMMLRMIPSIHKRVIEIMEASQNPAKDTNIQEAQLYDTFIEQAVIDVVNKFKTMGLIDPRFNVYT